ncbi:MAG: hypothetical protein ACM3S2_06175 [Ignavibacteriales bacterium]
MPNSKDILQQKASGSESLKSSLGSSESETHAHDDLRPRTLVDEEGKKVLVFQDPLYSREKKSVVNYTVFRGKWEFENIEEPDGIDPEKCAVKFTPVSDAAQIIITFKSFKDRVEFMDSIYSDKEMKQTGSGVNLEELANSKVLKTTGGLIGLSIAGYGLYKLFGGKKE